MSHLNRQSVKLIWKMHLLHPEIYRSDCFKRFGRVIIPNNLSIKFNQHQSELSTYTIPKQSPFTSLNLKQSLLSYHQFIQNALNIEHYDSTQIKQWIQEYKQLITRTQNTAASMSQNNTSITTNLIWHVHKLQPDTYYKESLILSNVDRNTFKQHVQNKVFAITNQQGLLIFGIISIIAFLVISSLFSIPNKIRNTFYASTTTCSSYDQIFCDYITGLESIFTTTDKLLAAQSQTEFGQILDDIIDADIDNNIIFYYANASFTLSPSGSLFNTKTRMQALINAYGADICEKTEIHSQITPDRVTTYSCLGWIYVFGPDSITPVSVEYVSLAPSCRKEGMLMLY